MGKHIRFALLTRASVGYVVQNPRLVMVVFLCHLNIDTVIVQGVDIDVPALKNAHQHDGELSTALVGAVMVVVHVLQVGFALFQPMFAAVRALVLRDLLPGIRDKREME